MKILFIGDIFGESGRRAIKNELFNIKKNMNIDLIIANAENCTHGRSLSLEHYEELMKYGINYFTMGNHTWNIDEIYDVLKNNNIVRPYNIISTAKQASFGNGTILFNFNNKKIRLTNLLGKSIPMDNLQTNPFIEFEKLLNNVEKSDIHIVDFHCETTSEKNAFLKSFAGKLTAILCTHTHVQTADERIINGTGYITDVGMTGGRDGVIGADSTSIVDMFFEKIERFKLASAKSKYQFNAVILSIDNKSNELKKIERLFINEN